MESNNDPTPLIPHCTPFPFRSIRCSYGIVSDPVGMVKCLHKVEDEVEGVGGRQWNRMTLRANSAYLDLLLSAHTHP